MISATLDTSVYIRALHLGGPAASLIGHAHDARGKLLALANHVAPTVSLTGSKEDPDDDRTSKRFIGTSFARGYAAWCLGS